jgi:hypothetical protein
VGMSGFGDGNFGGGEALEGSTDQGYSGAWGRDFNFEFTSQEHSKTDCVYFDIETNSSVIIEKCLHLKAAAHSS